MTTDWQALSARASFASHRLIGWIYWDPTALEGYRQLGLDLPGTYYINSRCAPLSAAGHQAVAAAFYSINPLFVELAMGMVDGVTTFDEIAAVRDQAVARGLREFAPSVCDGLADLAPALWAAADQLPSSGRVLFAAHRQAPRPDDQVLSGWLAVNCLREWRGDSHFAILAAHDLSAAQAGILHNAMLNYPPDWIPRSRGSDDSALADAVADLEARGLATDGHVNQAGLDLRAEIEERTDRLSERAWRLLGQEGTHRFLDLVQPVGEALLARIDETAGTEWMPAAREPRA